ncbi:MAG: 50S ribosomal protein L4 [Enterobacterales bacterium]
MELILHDLKNKVINLSSSIFGVNYNKSLIHQVIVTYLSRSRQGSRAQKNRSEVSGSKKKPWKQKGTGHARVGSIRNPIWRSGGVTFAAKPYKYKPKINKKMYRGALKSIFSELIRQKRLIIVKDFIVDSCKTKSLIEKLKKMNLFNVLIIIDEISKNLFLSSRNLNKIHIQNVLHINPVNLIKFEKTLITVNAIKCIEDILNG